MKLLLFMCTIIFAQGVYASIINLNPINLSKTNSIDISTGSWLYFGTGYDDIKNDTRGNCVKVNNLTILPHDSKNAIYERTYSIELIESSEELSKSLEVSASASLMKGWGEMNAMAKYVESQKINNYSLYILVKAELVTHIKKVDDALLKEEYLQKLSKNIGSFRRSCGNEFVNSIKFGGSLYAVLRLETNSSEDQQSLKARIKGSVGTFSSAVEMKQRLEKHLKGEKLNILTYQLGGGASNFATDLDTMLEQVVKFPSEVVKYPAPLKAYTTDYYVLKNYPSGFSNLDTTIQKENMEYLGSKRLELVRLRNNILYILSNPEQFSDADVKLLQENENEINSSLNVINRIARKCYVSLDNCMLPESLSFPLINLPKRIDGNEVSRCFSAANEVCGLIYREDQSQKCGVQEYEIHSHNSCGVLNYKLKRSKQCGIEKYKLKINKRCGCKEKSTGFHACLFGCNCRKYKSCRLKEHGIESYKSCRRKEHGVEKYKSCISKKPKKFKTCRHKSHGIQSVKECMVKTVRSFENGTVVFERCENQ